MKKTVLLLAGFALATSQASAASLPKEIRFGEVGSTNVRSVGGKPAGIGLVDLAEHLGYFEEEFGKDGPARRQLYFFGGPPQNEAIAQGQLDFGSYGSVPNVIGLAGGIPAHIVIARRSTGATGTNHIAVRPDSPIKSVVELKGKRIAVPFGTNPYQWVVQLLEWRSISDKEVKLINLSQNESLVALNGGAVDAIWGGANLFILRDQGKLRLLEESRQFRQEASASGYLVADKFAAEYPDTLRRIVKVLVKASWWASEEKNREQLLTFIATRSLSYEHTKEEYAGSLKERYNPVIDDWVIDAFQKIVRFSARQKLIRKEVDESVVRSWFAPQVQEAALKELKLEGYWSTPTDSQPALVENRTPKP